MTVAFLLKTELLQSKQEKQDLKKQDEWYKMKLNWTRFNMMMHLMNAVYCDDAWFKNKSESNLNQIWIKFRLNIWVKVK